MRHQTTLQFVVTKGFTSILPVYWLRATHSLGSPMHGVRTEVVHGKGVLLQFIGPFDLPVGIVVGIS